MGRGMRRACEGHGLPLRFMAMARAWEGHGKGIRRVRGGRDGRMQGTESACAARRVREGQCEGRAKGQWEGHGRGEEKHMRPHGDTRDTDTDHADTHRWHDTSTLDKTHERHAKGMGRAACNARRAVFEGGVGEGFSPKMARPEFPCRGAWEDFAGESSPLRKVAKFPPVVKIPRHVTNKFTENSDAREYCEFRHVQRCTSRRQGTKMCLFPHRGHQHISGTI